MQSIVNELDKITKRFSEDAFLGNKGLSNEVGIHILCYDPSEEMIVKEYVKNLKDNKSYNFRVIERNLYDIFLQICEEKRILSSIPNMEEKKGQNFLLDQLQKIATPEAFVERMKYDEHQYGDILFITGVGEVFPFMRSHKILDNIQHVFSDIPVVMFYPGTFNGQELGLFGKFHDGNYYRAFNML